mgnify:CR=1 FL=1
MVTSGRRSGLAGLVVAGSEYRHQALAAGFDDFVRKPFREKYIVSNLLLKEAEAVFHPETLSEAGFRFPQGMEPDKVWAILKEMDGEEAFVEAFNQLDQERRGSVAEHVLTKCNIFSGRAAVFSSRYNSATGLLE